MRSFVGFMILSAPYRQGRSDPAGRPPSRCCMVGVLNVTYAALI
jgi:hypothetical protein